MFYRQSKLLGSVDRVMNHVFQKGFDMRSSRTKGAGAEVNQETTSAIKSARLIASGFIGGPMPMRT